jgi:predicted nucleic acid-binding protein
VLFEPVASELERVLVEKLSFEPSRWLEVDTLLRELAVEAVPAPSDASQSVTGDPDDDVVLACAVNARVEVLASGDRKHLLPVGEHSGVRILTPQALLAELREE